MKRLGWILCGVAVMGAGVGLTDAQYGDGPRWGMGGGAGGRGGSFGRDAEYIVGNEPIDELPEDRNGVPNWAVDPNFKADTFTFVRLQYTTVGRTGGRGFGRGGAGRRGTGTSWKNDWPYSDLNFSLRLQQMTSMKVNPEPLALRIDDPRLFEYPFVYIIQAGRLEFTEEEVAILRRYLKNGGFLMVDDIWGPDQENWYVQVKRIFPNREPEELTLEHPIFHCVFDLKEIPQVPAIQRWYGWARAGQPERTWYFEDDPKPHYRAIYDDQGRMMVLECANTDLGDGWEREGENLEYFHRFSEKWAYPMGINIVFYAMTH